MKYLSVFAMMLLHQFFTNYVIYPSSSCQLFSNRTKLIGHNPNVSEWVRNIENTVCGHWNLQWLDYYNTKKLPDQLYFHNVLWPCNIHMVMLHFIYNIMLHLMLFTSLQRKYLSFSIYTHMPYGSWARLHKTTLPVP